MPLKKLIPVVILLITGFHLNAQKPFYFKLKTSPSISWRGDEASRSKLVNAFGISAGYEFNKKFSLETGIGFNKVGYKYIRTVESIGVIDGFNAYILEGGIPVKQKFTERFIEIPLQFNYLLKTIHGLAISCYPRVSLNFFNQDVHKDWYYYKTDKEFSTKNTFTGTQGRDKLAFSYQLGINLQKNITQKIILGAGINYKNLYHNHKFPFKVAQRSFNNIGGECYLLCQLISDEKDQ